MSNMLAEIKRIIKEDISIRVNQYDVMYEAITNAVHANAKIITVYLDSMDNPIPELKIQKKLDSIMIVDDGDGFTKDNYLSFCKYRTEHKKSLGCKGVGRFVYLKVYQNAQFQGSLKQDQSQLEFLFDQDFETDNIQRKAAKVPNNRTEIILSSLTPEYYNPQRGLDRRINLNIEEIRTRVLLNLIPTLYFNKKAGKEVMITFINQTNGESISIRSTDIPQFKEKDFQIHDKFGLAHDFKLTYTINEAKGLLHSFYCANNRTVSEFSEKDLSLSLPVGHSGFFLLEGEYLNDNTNNDRNDFNIFPVKTDPFSPLSWEIINTALKKEVADIIKLAVPEAESMNASKLREIQEERPYLASFIDEDDIDMAGFLDKKQIIEKAKRSFDQSKEKVLTNAGKKDYTNQELEEAVQLAQNELVSYIHDRVQVLQRLKTMVNKKEQVESVIHNLLMSKYTQEDYCNTSKNNLWLLDDRFTTYSFAASDKRIKDVLNHLGENSEDIDIANDKPDLAIFFNRNPNESKGLKSVLVEIKPFDYANKSDRKKFAGITQLIDYVKAFKQAEQIEEIYGFLVTDVDQKLAERLEGDNYIPLFSLEDPIYHRFYDKLNISIYVVSAKTLITDAEARNKVFLDIIRKQSKLNKLLEKVKEEPAANIPTDSTAY